MQGTESEKTSANPGRQIGIVLASRKQPAWAARSLEKLLGFKDADFTIIFISPDIRAEFRDPCPLIRLYRWLDRMLFPVKEDAFLKTDVMPLISGLKTIKLNDLNNSAFHAIINLSPRSINSMLLKFTKKVWSFCPLIQPWYGISELINNKPVLPVSLWLIDKESSSIICGSYSQIDRLSLNRTLSPALFKAASFPQRVLYGKGGVQSEEVFAKPSFFCVIRIPFVILARICNKTIRLMFLKEQWSLAIAPRIDLDAAKIINPPKDHFWADPFPVAHENRTYIFFEEWSDKLKRGRIVVSQIDNEGGLGEPEPVLSGEEHFSYPFVFKWENSYYLIPETRSRKTVELYRASRFPNEWEHVRVLLGGIEAVDATLHFDGRLWWMFVNVAEKGSSTFDELHLFHAKTLLGPWKPHRLNPVKSDVRSSRPAGRLFMENGELFRPSQDCSVQYGRRIIINRVLELNENSYREELSSVIEPWLPGQLGIHTMNREGQWIVADVLTSRPFLRRICKPKYFV